MGQNPAFQFYPGDWERDLTGVPLEVEGFWIRVICKLWWANPKGTLTRSLPDFARTLAEDPRKVRRMFEELKNRHIAEVKNENGLWTITSRRMIKDEKIRDIRKLAGGMGGNPSFEKGKPNPYYNDNQKDKQRDKQKITPSSSSSSSVFKDIKAKAVPPFIPSKEHKEEVSNLSIKVYQKFKGSFNPYQWLNRNQGLHPLTHLHVLKQMLTLEGIKDPWPYANKIALIENGNYNAADYQKEADLIKEEFAITAKNFFGGKIP